MKEKETLTLWKGLKTKQILRLADYAFRQCKSYGATDTLRLAIPLSKAGARQGVLADISRP